MIVFAAYGRRVADSCLPRSGEIVFRELGRRSIRNSQFAIRNQHSIPYTRYTSACHWQRSSHFASLLGPKRIDRIKRRSPPSRGHPADHPDHETHGQGRDDR